MKEMNTLWFKCFILLIFVLGTTSCSSSDDAPKIDITGKWLIQSEKINSEKIADQTLPNRSETSDEEETEEAEEQEEQNDNETINWKLLTYSNEQMETLTFEGNGFTRKQKEKIRNSGTYNVNKKELSLNINGQTFNADINLLNDKLELNFTDNDSIKFIKAIRVTPPSDEDNGENGDSDNEPDENDDKDDEEQDRCSARHQHEVPLGDDMNPIRIELNTEVIDTLNYNTKHGFKYRYYLQVEPYKHYNIRIYDIEAEYNDELLNILKKIEVTAKESFITSQELKKVTIRPNTTNTQMTINPANECLYIEIFSYQDDIKYKFIIEEK